MNRRVVGAITSQEKDGLRLRARGRADLDNLVQFLYILAHMITFKAFWYERWIFDYWNSFGKENLSLALSSRFAVFDYSKYRTTFCFKSKMAPLVSDDEDPIYPIYVAIENDAELSETRRASISRSSKIAKTSGKYKVLDSLMYLFLFNVREYNDCFKRRHCISKFKFILSYHHTRGSLENIIWL